MKVPVLESVFLSRSPLPETRDFRRVLVLGGDMTGRGLAVRLVAEGYEVTALGYRHGDESVPGIISRPDTVLERIDGFIGGFDAVLVSPEGSSTERFGFVVAAQPAERVPKFDDNGLAEAGRVISLSALEDLLATGGTLVPQREDWFHAVFLCGLKGEADPAAFVRVFDAIEQLRDILPVQPYVFTSNVKVAAAGLERRYRRNRDAGTLFFKFDGSGPVYEDRPDGLAMVFADPILGIELELVPDLIVVDENQIPPRSLKPLLEVIPSSAVTAPFLQPESTRFSGVGTAKKGIYAVGASRGNFMADSAATDVEAAVVALKTSAQEDARPGLPGPPIVDSAKCTICLTCVRLCPHGAMSFRTRAEADPLSCFRCGICAVECPMEAITLEPPSGGTDIAQTIARGLAHGNRPHKIVAFLCSRSARHAMEAAGPGISRILTPVIVACAGTVDPSHIMMAFQEGADGVLVAGCHTGNCASLYGSILAGERVNRSMALLEDAGLDPNRLKFTTVASNTPGDFARSVQDLVGVIAVSKE